MSRRAEFSVYQFFPDESYEKVLEFVSLEEAVKMVAQLGRSVGGRIGTTRRIIATDGGDQIVLEWQYGKGITFPTTEQLKEA